MIKANQQVGDVLTPDKIYLFPDFSMGKIHFKDKTVTQAMLNYNRLNGEIEFVDQKQDTLAIAKHQMLNIDHLVLNNDTFFYHDGYLRQVFQTEAGKILDRQMLAVLRRNKIGAFDKVDNTSTNQSMATYADFRTSLTRDLKIRENITLGYTDQYFITDNYDYLPASKKNFLKMFSRYREILNSYFDKNNLNFQDLNDLQKVMSAMH